MYSKVVPKIKNYVQEGGPQCLVDVGVFVLSSIQTPLSRTQKQVACVKVNGVNSPALWGFKRSGFIYLEAHKKRLFQELVEKTPSEVDAVEKCLEVPGFGLPKASFFLQCLGYNTACLDVHNLAANNLPIAMTKVGDVSLPTKRKKVEFYVNYVQEKGAEKWWDEWCEYVAGNRMNRNLTTANAVSEFHYEAISV